jgi:hypothetical protein
MDVVSKAPRICAQVAAIRQSLACHDWVAQQCVISRGQTRLNGFPIPQSSAYMRQKRGFRYHGLVARTTVGLPPASLHGTGGEKFCN